MTSAPCQEPCAGLCTESGFAAAYTAHRPRLLAKAMGVVADRQHAEDAVQVLETEGGQEWAWDRVRGLARLRDAYGPEAADEIATALPA